MDEHWDVSKITHLARLAGLDVAPQEAAFLAEDLAALSTLAELLPAADTAASPACDSLPGRTACPLRDDVLIAPEGDPWPPALPRTDDGMLAVPPIVRQEKGDA